MSTITDLQGRLRVACELLAECEAFIGAIDPECDSEAESLSKLRCEIVDFLAESLGDPKEFALTGS